METAIVGEQHCLRIGLGPSLALGEGRYIADMAQKAEMDRAWGEWVDRANPPMRACLGATLDGKDLVEIVVTVAK